MRIIVRPRYERGRTFKHLVPAMQFAEAARQRQGPITATKRGGVAVNIFDGYSPHVVAVYGWMGGSYGWTWGYAKR